VYADFAALGLFLVVFTLLGFWQTRAYWQYLDEFDARRETGVGLAHVAELVVRSPLRALIGIPRRTAIRSRLIHQRQDDPGLEALRREYFLRRNIWLTASVLSFIALAVFLNNAKP
jgi:hypothetical protein